MITRLNVTTLFVLDKDEALDFYVDKLGLEKGNDVSQGDYRWLTVRAPGDQPTEVSFEVPGAPMHDEAFTRLVDAHYAALYRFALSLAKSAADASDLTQQTFFIWATKGDALRDACCECL